MSEFLPGEARRHFDNDDLLLRMETLKRKLSDERGIHTKETSEVKSHLSVSLTEVIDLLSYLKGLIAFHPNKRIGLALTAKITHIVNTIRRITHG